MAAEIALQDAAVRGAVEDARPRLRARARGRALPWRAVRPCASCSGTGRRAWCRRNGPSSCRGRRRCPSPRPCRLRPSRCAPCPAAICRSAPTLTPAAEASIAARSPAPPAPITSTSCSCCLIFGHLEDSPVGPDAHRAQAHVEVGEADPEQAAPGPQHVAAVEAAHAVVGLLAHRRCRQIGRERRRSGGAANGSRRCSSRAESTLTISTSVPTPMPKVAVEPQAPSRRRAPGGR